MTQAETIAVQWLQTTVMPNSAYPYYSRYFAELLSNGWTEVDLLKLPQITFELYEAATRFMHCTVSEFARSVLKDREKIEL